VEKSNVAGESSATIGQVLTAQIQILTFCRYRYTMYLQSQTLV